MKSLITLFDLEMDPTRSERLLQKFSENCSKHQIIQCYKNKLEYNCKYNIDIENIISEIENKFIESEQLPWWLDLID